MKYCSSLESFVSSHQSFQAHCWKKIHRKFSWVSDNGHIAEYKFVFLSDFLIIRIDSGVWLTISIIASVTLNIFTEFKWTVIGFLLFICFASCVNVVMAVGVNLFPTKYRGMATSFIMMSGRFGSFVGSSIIGVMLANMCKWIFYMNAALLISMLHHSFRHFAWKNELFFAINSRFFLGLLGCIIIFSMMNASNSSEQNETETRGNPTKTTRF